MQAGIEGGSTHSTVNVWSSPDHGFPLGDPDSAAGQDVEGVAHGALPHDVLSLSEQLGLQHIAQSGQHHTRQPSQQRDTLQEVNLP